MPFIDAQTLPQPPQAARLLVTLVSQPLTSEASQLSQPRLQVTEQVMLLHAATAFGLAGQTLPHLPQLVIDVRGVSQPGCAGLQSAKPRLQVIPQVPALHVGAALGANGHAAPQREQCEVVLAKFVSQPSDGTPLQSPKPVLQVVTVHVRAVQVDVAWASVQTI